MSDRRLMKGLLLTAVLASVALLVACGGKAKATPAPEPTPAIQPGATAVATATTAPAPTAKPAAAIEPTATRAPAVAGPTATPRPTVAPAPTSAATVVATVAPTATLGPGSTATPGATLAPVGLDELDIPGVVIEAGPLLGDLGGFGAGSVVIPTDLMGGLDLSGAAGGAP